MVLMDVAARYANYNSDLTRTVPVNGKFTDRQRDVYNAVLRVMRACASMLKPGVIIKDYQEEVGLLVQEELIGLGLISQKEVDEQDPDKPAYKKYFMHGTSHHIGLDVHDVGDNWMPVKEGMVFTIEPGIYFIPLLLDELRATSAPINWTLVDALLPCGGIRIEDNIWLTDAGAVNLTREAFANQGATA